MRLATTYTRAQAGLDAPEVSIEVHLAAGLPALHLVGLAETAVKESRERVRAAIQQSGFEFPPGKITVNLAPADLPKAGSRYDLAIAVAILAASGQIESERLAENEFLGELAFSGALRTVPGLLPSLLAARRCGRQIIVPHAGSLEASLLPRADVRLAGHLVDVIRHLNRSDELPTPIPAATGPLRQWPEDLADVRGQLVARRALEVAAAGGHHLLLRGPPGTGKTMLARRLAGLLPPLRDDEALEVAALQSLAGSPPESATFEFRRRPFRAPHHTASAPALVGGGRTVRPGEVSLAHRGVLFLDELPEFSRLALEALREPLTTGRMTVARAARTVEFPADFQLVAAMNPCPCGFAGDREQPCTCTPDQIRRYQTRVSGPLLDRIDLLVEVTRPGLSDRASATPESSRAVLERVLPAVDRALARQGVLNARLDPSGLKKYVALGAKPAALLEQASQRFSLSARAQDSVKRVARTIADLAGATEIAPAHLAEALSRRADRRVTAISGPP